MLQGHSRDSGLLLHWDYPWMRGPGRTSAHLGTGLVRLSCPKHLGRCLLFLPPLTLQHLEKGNWRSLLGCFRPLGLAWLQGHISPLGQLQALPSVLDKGLDTTMGQEPDRKSVV